MKTIPSFTRWGGRCRAALIILSFVLFVASVLFSHADTNIVVTLTDAQYAGAQYAAGTNNATDYAIARYKEAADSWAAQKAAADKTARDAKYEALSKEDKAEVNALIEEKAPK